ncbi:hypothetical protein OG413_20690 [Streptomyces sp. NBC_01433]|uniref:hypothetical protein n=1 Tax=Streptomyces sp. NBC_01433 TaxID=2903864 RepID=UPI0022593018|nr:hypothetical protein [Streptomyces sp. NBC_01433]MCX4677693.1 hypothetical protein [Streptomyces sp. NBC_01433]
MGIEADENGTEDTGRLLAYPEPDAEPQCWTHHSNSCGCGPEEWEQNLDAGGHRYSTEPPFPPGRRPVTDADVLSEPSTW